MVVRPECHIKSSVQKAVMNRLSRHLDKHNSCRKHPEMRKEQSGPPGLGKESKRIWRRTMWSVFPDCEPLLALCFCFPYGCSSPFFSHLNHNPLITPTVLFASELSAKSPPCLFSFFLVLSPSHLTPFLPSALTDIPFRSRRFWRMDIRERFCSKGQ